MEKLEQCERIVAEILQLLISNGLIRANISLDSIEKSRKMEPSDSILFEECMVWLEKEGIIRHEGSTLDGEFILCSMTAYGFSLMNYDFQVGGSNKKLGAAVKDISEGKKDYSGIGDFFGGILGGFIKSTTS